MNMNNEFDEKQLMDRGRCFQSGFASALFTTLALYLINDSTGITFEPYAAFMVSFWLPLTVCFLCMIVKNAYEGVNRRSGRILFTFYGIVGAALLITYAFYHDKPLMVDNEIMRICGSLFAGVCMVITCIVYWAQQYRNHKKFQEE